MKATSILKPKALLALYSKNESSDQSYHNNDDENIYIEIAPILNDGKPGAFTPASEKALGVFGKQLYEFAAPNVSGVLPKGIVYLSLGVNVRMVWITKPAVKPLQFTEQYGCPSGKMEVPWLLWDYDAGQLRLFSFPSKPSLSSPIYFAPFPNIDTKGLVCLGSAHAFIARSEATSFKRIKEAVEAGFFLSKFTHVTNSNAVSCNMLAMLKGNIEEKKPFDPSVLRMVMKKVMDEQGKPKQVAITIRDYLRNRLNEKD